MHAEALKPLPNDKIFISSKLNTFADNNLNVVQMMQFFFDKVKNILGEG